MTPSSEKESHAAAAAAGGQAGAQDPGGDNNKLARQLLKPRRRAQIEVWLGETVGEQETQYCTAGREFGHRSDSDSFMPQPTGQPDQSPHSTPMTQQEICPVCGRSPEAEREPSAHPPEKGPLPRLIEGKGKHMLRGIRAAIGQLRARDGGEGGGDDDDDDMRGPGRAVVSTAMFLAEASEDGDSSVATAFSSSGPFGGEDGKASPDGRKALEERMKRLMRAQKLLEKSQASR